MTFFSTTITPISVAQPILANKIGIEQVTQIQIIVRSMGDATVISVGGTDQQDRRMTGAGDNISIDTPQGKRYINVRSLFIKSDGTTPVVEIIGDTFI
jgi:hypothetical protein